MDVVIAGWIGRGCCVKIRIPIYLRKQNILLAIASQIFNEVAKVSFFVGMPAPAKKWLCHR
jgi:hypothetical protein